MPNNIKKLINYNDPFYQSVVSEWKNGNLDAKTEGGESPLDVKHRQERAWNYIMSKEEEKTILVCMHGRGIKVLLCTLLKIPLSRMDDFQHQNLCLYKLLFSNKKYKIELSNYTDHLK